MATVPTSTGLYLCDYVIVEERSRNASLINTFTARRAEGVPVLLNPFHAFTMMSDGHGEYEMALVFRHLEQDRELLSMRVKQTFPSPLTAVRLNLRIERLRVPAFGTYDATLLANRQWVAHCVFQILPKDK